MKDIVPYVTRCEFARVMTLKIWFFRIGCHMPPFAQTCLLERRQNVRVVYGETAHVSQRLLPARRVHGSHQATSM
jgi:hypothetical protein